MTTPPPTPPRVNATAARTIAVATAALGAAVIVGTVWSGAAPTVAAAATRTEERTLAVDGVDQLSIDASAASLVVRFDDIDEAELEVRGSGDRAWTFDTDEGGLRVSSPDGPFLGFWGSGSGNGRAVLTLPRELEGIDAEVRFGAGSLDAEGDFGDLSVDLGAGDASLAGSARTLSIDVGAGRGEVDLAGVQTANLELNAGRLEGRLTGEAPSQVTVSVSAGSLDLVLPDDTYDVTSDVSAGGFDSRLDTAASSTHRVHAEVAAGNVELRSDD